MEQYEVHICGSMAEVKSWRRRFIKASGREDDMEKLLNSDKDLRICKEHMPLDSFFNESKKIKLKWGVLPVAVESVFVSPRPRSSTQKLEIARNEEMKMEIENEKEQKSVAEVKEIQHQIKKKRRALDPESLNDDPDLSLNVSHGVIADLNAEMEALNKELEKYKLENEKISEQLKKQEEKLNKLQEKEEADADAAAIGKIGHLVKPVLSYEAMQSNVRLQGVCMEMIGVSSIKTFDALFRLFDVTSKGLINRLLRKDGTVNATSRSALSPKNQMLLTLFLLRTGVSQTLSAAWFGVSEATVSNIFAAWLPVLRDLFAHLWPFPSQKEVFEVTPTRFIQVYGPNPNIRIIIDATETQIEKARNLPAQRATWSEYKQRNTVKFLVGISPAGAITFVSDAYPGSISDPALVEACGILKLLNAGDNLLADKGFTIFKELNAIGAGLLMPPKRFAGVGSFTASETLETRKSAHLRIHVERANARLRAYRYINKTVRISQADLFGCAVKVCAGLCNLQCPLTSAVL